MTSPGETLSFSVPNTEYIPPEVPESLFQQKLQQIKQLVGRISLSLALAIPGGAALGVASEALETGPSAAFAVTDDYPDKEAPCVNANDPDRGKIVGTGKWCDNYDWGYFTKDEEGRITGSYTNSSRLYGYRNCTDWVAWRIPQLGVGSVPSGWRNGEHWDDAASAAHYTVDNTPEPGDIASWEGTFGHVAVVESVNSDGSVNISEYNKGQNGVFGTRSNVTGVDHFIDLNGTGKGINNEPWPPGSGGPTPVLPDPLNLSFIRLNDPRGNAWVDSYSESSSFGQLVENTNSNYPVVPTDGSVVPLFQPDGDLSFVNLSYPGHAQVVTYSEASGYKQVIENVVTAYPSVAGDGAVIPKYQFDGDLSFIRLNDPRGVEVVAYSQASGYQTLTEQSNSAYPPVETDGSVVPLYWLNDDLIMLRLNHYSGHVEMYAYSKNSGYRQTVNQAWLPYPALSAPGVAPGKNVIPLLHPQRGEISFVRLNHSSGKVEVITYGGAGFQQTTFQGLAGYPAVAGDGSVIPRYSN